MQKPNDIIGEILGDWGSWQFRTVFLIFLCKIPSAWFMACIIFTAPFAKEGEYYCKPPQNTIITNKTDWIHHIHPIEQIADTNKYSIDFCHVYDDIRTSLTQRFQYLENQSDPFSRMNASENKIAMVNGADGADNAVPCDHFEHDSIYDSLVTQFDLVCSRSILVAWTQFWHLFGVLNGGILATWLLESISPRKVMLFGMITQIFCGCLTGLVNTFNLHVFFRFLSAVCCAQMYTAGQMIFSDVTGGKYRKSVICLFESFWGIGVIVLPLLAHVMKSWTSIYLAISLPTTFYCILWHWIPDSPRWLLKHGYVDEAKAVLLESIAANNRKYIIPVDFDDRLKQRSNEMEKEPVPLGWWSLWVGPKAIVTMIAVHTAWAIYVTNYNGMLLNIRAFGRDYIYVNTMVAGGSEIIGVLIAWFLVMKTEHKWLWTGLFNIFAGFFACAGFFLPPTLSEPISVALIMLTAMVAKAATTCSQTVLVSSTGELVPAAKQKIAVFSCVVWARIWLLTAPFIGVITFIHYLAPLVTFAQLGLIGGLATWLIDWRQMVAKTVDLNGTNIDNTDKYINTEIEKQDTIWTIERTRL